MSYRSILYTSRNIPGDLNHRFRKFQKSRKDPIVYTKPKTVLKLVEVEVEEDE